MFCEDIGCTVEPCFCVMPEWEMYLINVVLILIILGMCYLLYEKWVRD
jgi:hypothetical protein